jgi:CTP:molybdopterin cytidylyltransferase MocA
LSAAVIYVMTDLELPLRGRTYRAPEGEHVAVARGRDLDPALEHVRERPDCTGLAILGPLPESPSDLGVLAGRRLLVCSTDRQVMRSWTSAALKAEADVEWRPADLPTTEQLGEWALPVSGLVLAAGSSSRMGENKLLMDLGGRSLVMHVVEAASEGGCHDVTVVYSEPAVAAAVGNHARCLHNPEAATGMASSLRVGLAGLPSMAAGAMVLLGDQPLVGERTVRGLLRAWRREGARPAAAARYPAAEKWLPPVVVARSLWPELASLSGDAGARQVLEGHPELLDTVVAGGVPNDVDTAEDYANIVRLYPRSDPG